MRWPGTKEFITRVFLIALGLVLFVGGSALFLFWMALMKAGANWTPR